MIRKVVVIPTGTQVKVQSFDKEWDAWINVKPGSALQDRTQLKCVTSLSAENHTHSTTSPELPAMDHPMLKESLFASDIDRTAAGSRGADERNSS